MTGMSDVMNRFPRTGPNYPPIVYPLRTHDLVPMIPILDESLQAISEESIVLPRSGRAFFAVKRMAHNFTPAPFTPGTQVEPIHQIVLVPSIEAYVLDNVRSVDVSPGRVVKRQRLGY